MTSKKNIFLKKIDLLIISLEILSHHYKNNDKIQKFRQLRKNFKNNRWNQKNDLTAIIKYIYMIRIITQSYLLNKIGSEILKKYKKSYNIQQYISKFNNTQHTQRKYYRNFKLFYNTHKIKTNEMAIVNLYIISKLLNTKETGKLIKYLMTR